MQDEKPDATPQPNQPDEKGGDTTPSPGTSNPPESKPEAKQDETKGDDSAWRNEVSETLKAIRDHLFSDQTTNRGKSEPVIVVTPPKANEGSAAQSNHSETPSDQTKQGDDNPPADQQKPDQKPDDQKPTNPPQNANTRAEPTTRRWRRGAN